MHLILLMFLVQSQEIGKSRNGTYKHYQILSRTSDILRGISMKDTPDVDLLILSLSGVSSFMVLKKTEEVLTKMTL